jgi:uncharacterized membrane protein
MQPSSVHFFPLASPFMLLFLVIGVLVLALIEVGVIGYAYARVGVPHRYVFTLLFLSLIGSYVNIPVAELPPERVLSGREIGFFGTRCHCPAAPGKACFRKLHSLIHAFHSASEVSAMSENATK